MMKPFLRFGLALVLVAAFSAPAVAAGKRYVMVVNRSDALIDVGFLQPPTSGVVSLYGTLHTKAQLKFTLDAGEAKFVVKSKACHGSTYAMLPTRENVTVNVTNGCKVAIQ